VAKMIVYVGFQREWCAYKKKQIATQLLCDHNCCWRLEAGATAKKIWSGQDDTALMQLSSCQELVILWR
jgi:hypothetical protein